MMMYILADVISENSVSRVLCEIQYIPDNIAGVLKLVAADISNAGRAHAVCSGS